MNQKQGITTFKVLLDANILIDFFLKREYYESAQKIIFHAASGKCQAFATSSIIHTVGYMLTKTYGNEKAIDLMQNVLTKVKVIDSSHEITVNALHSKMRDIEDALQYYAGLHHKMDCFVSRDKKLKLLAIASLPVYEPEEFLQIVNAET